MQKKPNILYVHTHDTGRYVQPYGHAVSTPHIQKFAEQGVLFRQAFCASPTCSPSRAALLTGQYPHSCGMHGLASPPWFYRLENPRHLLMHTLQQAGYLTALAGLQHVSRKPPETVKAQGFEVLLNEDNLGEDVPDLHERAARFITQRTDARPWFLSLGFDQTHRDNRQGDPTTGACFSKPDPYDPAKLDGRYCLPPPIYPDNAVTRQDMASFREGVRRLDVRVGHVLAALDASGEADNTIVIVTTDHGIAWPSMKCNLTEHGLGVMLMMRGPGGFGGGQVVDAMVSHMDIFPTLCDLVGLPHPDWLQGKSLMPLMRGEQAKLHEELFFELGWHEVSDPQRAVRTERYKYVRRLDPIGPKPKNCDEGPTKRFLETVGWFDRDQGTEQLFDLFLDPHETCNRATDPSLSQVKAALSARLDAWMEQTNCPLRRGAPVHPPGLSA